MQASENCIAIGQKNDLTFYSLDESNKISKDGFAQGLGGNVKTIDFSTAEK